MPGDAGRSERLATTEVARPRPLDYYLVSPDGSVLVEEFALADDHSAVGLYSTAWTPQTRRWMDSAAFSRAMRVDPAVRTGVVAATRPEIEAVYRRLAGAELPDETTLRTYFHDYEPLAASAPLRLGPAPAAGRT